MEGSGNDITKKTQIDELLNAYFQSETHSIDRLVEFLNNTILNKKVKFPLLEHCGRRLSQAVNEDRHFDLCDQIFDLKTIGGNVLIGVILQHQCEVDIQNTISKTVEIVSKADIWYICDIIGERVFGHCFRHHPKVMIPAMKRLIERENRWVIRSLGAGFHNAVKWGLPAKESASGFQLLLTLATSKDKEIRQGIGWAAKTTAKFHPDIIEKNRSVVDDSSKVAGWFRRKITIGLERNRYAKGS